MPVFSEIGSLVQNPVLFNKTERPRELCWFAYLGQRQVFHLFFEPVVGLKN